MDDTKKLVELLGNLEEEKVLEFVKKQVSSGISADEALKVVGACQEGMAIVGDRFVKDEYFVADLIFAGEILTGALDALKPALAGKTQGVIGKMVLGTVQGDLHDIGKNIFGNISSISGIEVHDLGIDQTPQAFVNKIKEVGAGAVGMSGVLTLSIDSMKATIDAIKAAGLRDKVKIIIGGVPVTKGACEFVGADAYTINAAEGANIVKGWFGK